MHPRIETFSTTSSLLIGSKTQISPTRRLFSFANVDQPVENEPRRPVLGIENHTSHDTVRMMYPLFLGVEESQIRFEHNFHSHILH